jgi:hypothetical protein
MLQIIMPQTDRWNSEWFLIMHKADPGFTKKILWTDEATFNTNGGVN